MSAATEMQYLRHASMRYRFGLAEGTLPLVARHTIGLVEPTSTSQMGCMILPKLCHHAKGGRALDLHINPSAAENANRLDLRKDLRCSFIL